MKTTITIIPQQNYGLIVAISGEQDITVISKIEIPYNSISKVVGSSTIVTLDKNNQQLLLHDINGSFIESIDVPFGLAMNMKENVVYVGGNAIEGEVCYMVDLSEEEHTLKNINLPVPMAWGKAVDDILILENKMLLIDNIVFPKYTFEYDISEATKPVWVETSELPNERPYENIIKGDMNEKWMIYLSTSSSGWSGDEAHITIEGQYSNIISSSKKNAIVDICLIDDTLYVLTDIGLGSFDLTQPTIKTEDIAFIKHEIVADRIIKIDNTKLLLVSQYEYELLELDSIHYTGESIEERFWSYGSLDLSDRNLTVFPQEQIKNLEKLEHLDLSNNEIEIFPEVLRKCKKLRSLNLKFSGINKIPKWIEEFESLEYLNLSTINIDSPIPFMASRIKFPKNLRILNLRYCQISAIPPSVFELKDLEYLNLLENSISRIPQQIIDLKKLKTLKIRWENVSKFPDTIKDLPLETVEISADNRGEIPEVIYSMRNLKRIEARNAGIKTISDKIKNFSSLEYLDLENNYDLGRLPESIGKLKNLKRLDLSVCGLKELPESFCELTELEVLYLQHNELTMLPINIGKLTKLRKLDLKANQLTELPETLFTLSSLETLSIEDNRLEALPEEIGNLTQLKNLEIKGNAFSTLPESITKLTKLTNL